MNTDFFIMILVACSMVLAQTCTNGTSGCFRCVNSTHCGICKNEYRINLNYACQPCLVADCKKCQYRSDRCSSGLAGFTVINYKTVKCQVGNCSNCDGDIFACNSCMSSFTYTATNVCTPCGDPNCRICQPADPSICSVCKPNFYLNSNTCIDNFVANCSISSSVIGSCSVCFMRHGLVFGQCLPCIQPMCRKCNTNICQECEDLYGLTPMGTCIRCNDPKCITCQRDPEICTGCIYQPYLGLNNINQCSGCSVTNCVFCHRNVDFCQICSTTLGPDATGQCTPCTDPKCLTCDYDYTNCTRCYDMYGFNNYTCVPCTDSNCFDCLDDYDNCTMCKHFFGFSGDICVPCSDSQCFWCLQSYEICAQCINGYGLTNSICENCLLSPKYCLSCHPLNLNYCLSCPDGRYLSVYAQCVKCPIYCYLCSLNPTTYLVQCSSCIQNITGAYYLLQNLNCTQILCGDFDIHYLQQCDNQINIPYDGCSNGCKIQDNFTCFPNPNGNGSVCSYEQVLQMTFIKLSPKIDTPNQFVLTIKVQPPLNVFKISSEAELKAVFSINLQASQLKSLIYDSENGILHFNVQITQNIIKNTSLQIRFDPINSTLIEYSLTPMSSLVMETSRTLFYISKTQLDLSNIILYVSYMSSGLAWLGFFIGIFMKRLPGLQALFVLQIAFISFFLFGSDLLIIFEKTHPLKLATGYNYPFIGQDQDRNEPSIESPFFSQFNLSERLLLNNFNLSMVIQFICMLGLFITNLRIKKLMSTSKPQQQIQQQQFSQKLGQLNRLLSQYQFCYQLLMNSCLVSLIYFTLCCVIYIKREQIESIGSLVIMCLQILVLVATYVRFCYDPAPFDYFRFSFKLEQLAMRHYCIYPPVLVINVVLVVMFESIAYISLVLPTIMLAYTIIYRPYKELAQNIRSCWNMLVILSLLFYRVFVKQLCGDNGLNSDISVIYFTINVIALPITVIINLVLLIYYYWFYNYKVHQNKNRRLEQIQQYRKRLLGQLVQINPNLNIDKINRQSTFRSLINPNITLLEATNQLKQLKIKQKTVNNKDKHNQYELEDLRTLNRELIQNNLQHKLNITNQNNILPLLQAQSKGQGYEQCKQENGQGMWQQQKQKQNQAIPEKNSNNLRVCKQNVKRQKIGSNKQVGKNKIEKPYQYIFNNFSLEQAQNVKEGICVESVKIDRLKSEGQILYARTQSPQKLQRCIATNIIAQQQRFINLQAAINKTKQRMEQTIDMQIMDQYNKIDSNYSADQERKSDGQILQKLEE